jgi:prolyl-tRNA synthetase
MAMPVIKGEKTAAERFPGAVNTFCIEAMMQDRKALQAGTSHYLGQNFARAANIQFLNEQGAHQLAHTTSWGVSTRLIGGLIMTHSDDDGLVLPPRLAPSQIVIMPLIHKEETRAAVLAYCEKLKAELEAQRYAGEPVRVKIDNRDLRGGEKKWEWVKKGVPFLLEIGPRDVEGDGVFLSRRDKAQEKGVGMKRADLVATIADLLGGLQQGLLDKARAFQKAHTREIDSKEEFYSFFTAKNPDKPEIHAGFALTHYDGSVEVEEKIKEDLKVTVRCIPLDDNAAPGLCPFTGKPSKKRVVWGKSY